MEAKNNKLTNIKKIIKYLLVTIIILIIILLWLIAYNIIKPIYEIEKENKEADNQVKIIKELIWTNENFIRTENFIYPIFTTEDWNSEISIFPWKKGFAYTNKTNSWYILRYLPSNENNWANYDYLIASDLDLNEFFYITFKNKNHKNWTLIDQDPRKYNTVAYAIFTDSYYNNFVKNDTKNKLHRPNWEYYSWEFNINLKRDWYWEQYLLWSNEVKHLKLWNTYFDLAPEYYQYNKWIAMIGNRKDGKMNWTWKQIVYFEDWNFIRQFEWNYTNWELKWEAIYSDYLRLNIDWWRFLNNPENYLKIKEWNWFMTWWVFSWEVHTFWKDSINRKYERIGTWNWSWECIWDNTYYFEDWEIRDATCKIQTFKQWMYPYNKASISWDLLVRKNWWYYSWEYDSQKKRNWKWILVVTNWVIISWDRENDTPNWSIQENRGWGTYSWEYCNWFRCWKWIFKNDITFKYSWEYLSWKENWIWERIWTDWSYYSWERKDWEINWYWTLRRYVPLTKEDWDFINHPERFKLVYEVSWIWNNWRLEESN